LRTHEYGKNLGIGLPMQDARSEEQFRKWMDFARKNAYQRNLDEPREAPCVRISNGRYAKNATFEDRLTLEDRELLQKMGIAL
jgi:hypothetical protein